MRRSLAKFASNHSIAAVSAVATTASNASPSSQVSVAVDATPTPVEAPHLLEHVEEAKPFVNPKSLKAFSVSLLIGCVSAGSVYYLLSKTISNQFLEEKYIVQRIASAVAKEAEQSQYSPAKLTVDVCDHLVGDFTAPSTYAELKERIAALDQRRTSHSELPESNRGSQSVPPALHQEAAYRAKKAWNDTITNVQVSLETFAVEYKLRRERQAEAAIRAQLSALGIDDTNLKRVA